MLKQVICLSGILLASGFQIAQASSSDTCIKPKNPEHYRATDCLSEGLAWVYSADPKVGGKGFIDANGKLVIPIMYDSARDFHEGMAEVYRAQNPKTGVWDRKWGYINKRNQLVIDYQYDDVHPFKYGVAVVENDNQKYLINKKNQVIARLNYPFANIEFFEGLAEVPIRNADNEFKWGFIDTKGKVIIPFIYDGVGIFVKSMAIVWIKDKVGIINKKGELVIPMEYQDAVIFTHDLIAVKKNGKWGFVNRKNQVVIPFIYDSYASYYLQEDDKAHLMIENSDNTISHHIIDTRGRIIKSYKVKSPPAH